MFDLDAFAHCAPVWAQKLDYYPELTSSNDTATQWLEKSMSPVEGISRVILTDHQTAGRGRRGANWLAEKGQALLFSLIYHLNHSHVERLALVTGLAVSEALRKHYQVSAGIKWPNDVLIFGQKCCGILVENSGKGVVIGIGLNCASSPEDLAGISVSEASGAEIKREELLAHLLVEIEAELNASGLRFNEQMQRIRNQCALTGKEITFSMHGYEHDGKVHGLDDQGRLLVQQDNNLLEIAQAENIRVVR